MSKTAPTTGEVHFAATSRMPRAPRCMDMAGIGRFELLNLDLHEMMDGPTRSREHQHNVYHLLIFSSDQPNRFLLNHQEVDSHYGLCVFTHPRDVHCFSPRATGTTRYDAVTFMFEGMTHAPPQHEVLTYYTGLPVSAPGAFFQMTDEALQRVSTLMSALRSATPPRTEADAAQLHHTVMALFLLVAQHGQDASLEIDADSMPPEVKAHRYIDRHFTEGVPLTDVARDAGVSAAHLGRIFKKRYGQSPGTYRDFLRIESARNLLAHSDLLIKEIAYELGYPDASTFSKAFLRDTGSSPAHFRKKVSAPAPPHAQTQ